MLLGVNSKNDHRGALASLLSLFRLPGFWEQPSLTLHPALLYLPLALPVLCKDRHPSAVLKGGYGPFQALTPTQLIEVPLSQSSSVASRHSLRAGICGDTSRMELPE